MHDPTNTHHSSTLLFRQCLCWEECSSVAAHQTPGVLSSPQKWPPSSAGRPPRDSPLFSSSLLCFAVRPRHAIGRLPASDVVAAFYSWLPLNALSRLWGVPQQLHHPHPAEGPGLKPYSAMFGVNPTTCRTRRWSTTPTSRSSSGHQTEQRPIATAAVLTSPADGTVLGVGTVSRTAPSTRSRASRTRWTSSLGTPHSDRIIHPQLQTARRAPRHRVKLLKHSLQPRLP